MTQQHGHFTGQTTSYTYEHGARRLNPFSGGWTQGASWVKRLIIIYVVIWVVMQLSFRISDTMMNWWLLNIAISPTQVFHGKIWEFVTSMWMFSPAPQQTVFHMAFGLLMFYIFAPRVERDKGSGWFIRFFLLAGIIGAVFSFVVRIPFGLSDVPGCGATSAMYASIGAFGIMYHMEVFWIFWAVPVRILYIFFALLALELAWVIAMPTDPIDHIANLGGLLFALAYMRTRFSAIRIKPKKRPPSKPPKLSHPGRSGEKPSDFLEV